VRTLDTNFVVWLLIGDNRQQTPIAERAFLEWSSMTSTR
jgi:hypothetical protein